MAELMTVNLTTFTVAEKEAIEDLKRKRMLSSAVSTALHEYLLKVNPALNGNVAQQRVIVLSGEADVDMYLKDILAEKPSTTNYELKLMKTHILRKLKDGNVEINKAAGTMIIVPRPEIVKEPVAATLPTEPESKP